MFGVPVGHFSSAAQVGTSQERSLYLAGGGQLLNVGALGITTNGSFSIWTKPSAISSDKRLIGQPGGSTTQRGSISIGLTNPGNIELWNGANSTWYLLAPASSLVASKWQHLVFTVDGTNTKCYVNGVLKGTVAVSAWDYGVGSTCGIGAEFTASKYGNPYNGHVDEITFWDSALDQAQVTQLYNGGRPYDATLMSNYSTNCIRYYKINSLDTINSVRDFKSNVTAITQSGVAAGDFSTDIADPFAIPGNQIRLDGTDSASFTLRDGGDGYNYVSRWNDISGNNNYAANNTPANQPRRTANGIYVHTANVFLQTLPITLNGNVAAFIVFKPVALTPHEGAGSYNSYIGQFSSVTSSVGAFWQIYSNPGISMLVLNLAGSADDLGAANAVTAGETMLITIIKNSSEARIRKNGVQVASDVAIASAPLANYPALIGRWNNNTSNAEFNSFNAWNEILTVPQIETIENYIKNKWGIP